MMRRSIYILTLSFILLTGSALCITQKRAKEKEPRNARTGVKGEVRLITLDPGHFHAALVQKTMYPGVSPVVHVYAPPGVDLNEHLKRIELYNTRAEGATRWQEKLYTAPDFLGKMLSAKPGNVVVLAGNNRKKIDYILASLNAGINVLSDKPMCIDQAGFEKLKRAFKIAEERGLLLYDIMTERYEITTMLQRALVNTPELFGILQEGTPDDPAVTKESVHHLFKYVSGKPLRRPDWFFDVEQQGEGIIDVTTHLVDLIMWESFPEQQIAISDIEMVRGKRWATIVTREQFKKATGMAAFPGYLRGKLNANDALPYYSNGEMIYKLRGVHAKVSVIWNFEAPQGSGDTHYSIMRGTKANIIIRQGKEENFRPELYVETAGGASKEALEAALRKAVAGLQVTYPGLRLEKKADTWHVGIPDEHRSGHEAHFGQVTENYLRFLREGRLPAWEVPNMIAKYYTTMRALELPRE